MRVALGVAYDGSGFSGWQRQQTSPTVQQSLEQALSEVAAEPIRVHAAGRTDTGVHATGQVVHFDTSAQRPLRAWIQGVSALTPAGIDVRWAQLVDTAFHARFSATERRYLYVFCDRHAQAPGLAAQSWPQTVILDVAAMHRAAQCLVGEHDFSAFRGAGCQAPTALRRIHRVAVVRCGDLAVLDIAANAFLLHMVRNIASALAQVGRGTRPETWVAQHLRGRDRRELGPTAPAPGLYLIDVRYPGYDLPAPVAPPLLRALGDLARL